MNSQERSGLGIASLVFGILAIFLYFGLTRLLVYGITETSDDLLIIRLLLLSLVLSSIGIIFGAVAYFGKEKDPWGLCGFLLCIGISALLMIFPFLTVIS